MIECDAMRPIAADAHDIPAIRRGASSKGGIDIIRPMKTMFAISLVPVSCGAALVAGAMVEAFTGHCI